MRRKSESEYCVKGKNADDGKNMNMMKVKNRHSYQSQLDCDNVYVIENK